MATEKTQPLTPVDPTEVTNLLRNMGYVLAPGKILDTPDKTACKYRPAPVVIQFSENRCVITATWDDDEGELSKSGDSVLRATDKYQGFQRVQVGSKSYFAQVRIYESLPKSGTRTKEKPKSR